jgi:hypothetical protein
VKPVLCAGFCDPTFLSGNTCDDGKKCTTGDVCTMGKCKGMPVTCPASGKQCSMLTCAEKTGELLACHMEARAWPSADHSICSRQA